MQKERNQNANVPEVSVIVPVYNVEPYLRRCLDSLVNQTLQNIEIILVDDGSTDGCGHICDEYAAKDGRIRVIHQDNAGLSEARNAGIDLARADYLMFVDSDDWVEPEFCEVPLAIAKEWHADLVMFQFYRFKKGRKTKRHYTINEGKITQADALRLMLSDAGFVAWNKLYHRQLFLVSCYPKGMVYEDVALTPVLVHEAQRIYYSSAILYNYEKRQGSISMTLSGNNAQDFFDAITSTTLHLMEWGYQTLSEEYYKSSILNFVSWRWESSELNEKLIRYLRDLKCCPTHFSFKQRCKYHLCMVSPRLYQMVCRYYHLL